MNSWLTPSGQLLRLLFFRYVLFELLAICIVRSLLQELLVLRGGFVLHSRAVVKRSQTQMNIGHSQSVECQRLGQVEDCLRTLPGLQKGLTEQEVGVGRIWSDY